MSITTVHVPVTYKAVDDDAAAAAVVFVVVVGGGAVEAGISLEPDSQR